MFRFFFVLFLALFTVTAYGDERLFTYSYEPTVLPKGQFEFEQWITNQNGRKDQDFSRWDLRTEIEYGVTEAYQSAFYLNWRSTRTESIEEGSSSDTEFKGISWENIYQLTNPNLDLIGSALYAEVTTDGIDYELEGKILLSKIFGDLSIVANVIYEAEWEKEDGVTHKEAVLEFTMGGSYKIAPNWAIGIEARNKAAYPDGLNLSGQEFQSWSVGPNIHYGTPKWWTTLTILPQVWGNGDGSSGARQLEHEEEIEVRLLFGVLL